VADAAWDGTFHGAKASAGAYVWSARYFIPVTKQPVFGKGTVVLIR